MASQTTQLIVELLDRVSGPARGVANSLRGITRTRDLVVMHLDRDAGFFEEDTHFGAHILH